MSKKVLIVEDEIIIAEDIRQVLVSLKYEIAGVALKYSQALSLLESESVDFVLIDIMLGGAKSGIDLATTINEKYGIPFIFLTSHADAATVQKAKAVKPSGYLLKPFTKDDIYTTLEIAIAKDATKSQQAEIQNLTEREQEVLAALSNGNTDKEIAEKLFVSLHTVKSHLKSIYKKVGAKNRLEAVTFYANGISP